MRPTPAELRALARRDPVLGAALRKLAPFPGYPEGSAHAARTYFHSLVRSIVFQMLSTKAAETIYGRVCAVHPGRRFPRPAEVLALPEGQLRACGLSNGKTQAILDLAQRIESGRLKLSSLGRRSDEEVIAQLTEVRGIGVWTAQIFLIFRLGRLDVLPLNDVGIQEGLRCLDGKKKRPSPKQLQARAQAWSPLGSVASCALWQLADAQP